MATFIHLEQIIQVVVVNSISSIPQRLDFGVPQGSVLGPLLFVLCTQPFSRIAVHQSGSDLHVFGRYTAFQFSTVGGRVHVRVSGCKCVGVCV